MAECGFKSGMFSRWKAATGRMDVVVASRWTLIIVDVSRKLLGSLDTCHHLGTGQILTDAFTLSALSYHVTLSLLSKCKGSPN